LSSGTRFDEDYVLGKKIGAGAFGEVFLATKVTGGTEVAVKKIKKSLLFTPEERESVSREVGLGLG
jgi:serine/threonine protein kinase